MEFYSQEDYIQPSTPNVADPSFIDFDYISDDDSCVIIVEGLPPIENRCKSSQSTLSTGSNSKMEESSKTVEPEVTLPLSSQPETSIENIPTHFQASILEGSVVCSVAGSVMSNESRILDGSSVLTSGAADYHSSNNSSQLPPSAQDSDSHGIIGDSSNWSQMFNELMQMNSSEPATLPPVPPTTSTNPPSSPSPPCFDENVSSKSWFTPDAICNYGDENIAAVSTVVTVEERSTQTEPTDEPVLAAVPAATAGAVVDEVGSTVTTTKPVSIHQETNTESVDQEEALDRALCKISFLDFTVGDIALFLPINDQRTVWMAFHVNKPHRYLAEESLKAFLTPSSSSSRPTASSSSSSSVTRASSSSATGGGGEEVVCEKKPRSRILGRIVFIETLVTSADVNPFHLSCGTLYHLCYVEPIVMKTHKSPPLPTHSSSSSKKRTNHCS